MMATIPAPAALRPRETTSARREAPIRMAVMSSAGHVSMCTEAAEGWLTESRRARIHALIQGFRQPVDRPVRVSVDGVSVRIVSMVGELGVFGVWIDGSADPVEALSPRLRQVAEFAAAGATASEIGDTLDLSTHTVRGYLKDVYRRLGVANRVELSTRLRSRNGKA